MNKNLKQMQRRLRFALTAIEQANIGIFWSDADGHIFFANDKLCRWLGYAEEELLTCNVADIYPEIGADGWSALWGEIQDQDTLHQDGPLRGKAGGEHLAELYLSCADFEGEAYLLGFAHDLSHRQQLEARLRQAEKMEAIGNLAGGVAHDFNNLLSAIFGYSDILRRTLNDGSDKQLHAVREIRRAGMRARDLTRQLLTFARRQPMQMVPLDLNQVILEFEGMVKRTIREDIQIEKDLTPALPTIEGDVVQIEQLILNLALNAQEAMPGGGTLIFETSVVTREAVTNTDGYSTPAGEYVMLAVSDTGLGIDPEVLPHIFEPFFTTRDKSRGTGLGLSSVYGTMRQHHGHLWANSEPGKGTSMKAYFPLSSREVAVSPEEMSQELLLTGTETVMVVEDQQQVRALVCEILSQIGYSVLEAPDSTAALNMAKEHAGPIELLVTDVIMPVLNGRELYERLQQQRSSMRVLYISGYTDDVIAHHGVLDEGVNFLQKPFSAAALTVKVRQVLNQ